MPCKQAAQTAVRGSDPRRRRALALPWPGKCSSPAPGIWGQQAPEMVDDAVNRTDLWFLLGRDAPTGPWAQGSPGSAPAPGTAGRPAGAGGRG